LAVRQRVTGEATIALPGRLAQLGEHQLDKLGVTGSSPVPPTSEAPAKRGFSFSGETEGPLFTRPHAGAEDGPVLHPSPVHHDSSSQLPRAANGDVAPVSTA
jgi:hypothetical protein